MKLFYDHVSFGCMGFIHNWHPKEIVNLSSYMFSSIYGTLDSIESILRIGHINDAYCLCRKFYDVILIDIYLDILVKTKREEITNDIMDSKSINSLFDENVRSWVENRFRIPKIEKILLKIKNSKFTKEMYPLFDWDSKLKNIREILDNNVHGNSIYFIITNCNDVYIKNREKELDKIQAILKHLMTLHLAFLFHLNPEYMLADDYINYLECNMNPPDGSNSWIATYAQDAFDEFIKPIEKLAKFIKDTCFLEIK